MDNQHNGHDDEIVVEQMTAEDFSKLTMGQLYDMVEQSGEKLFCLSLDGDDGKPFAMFALALGPPEVLARYAEALHEQKPTILDAIGGALNG